MAMALLATLPAAAALDPVLPGVDLFQTPPGSTYQDFSGTPIPAGFFDPGSDPFSGVVFLEGNPPLLTVPPFAYGGPGCPPCADTVVERKEVATIGPVCPSSDTIDIEIVALSLTSSSPITVTYSAGSPELWDVDVCLSTALPQPIGSMTITHECDDGGSWTSTLPVQAKFTFIRQSDSAVRTLDGPGVPVVTLSGGGGWVHVPSPGFGVMTAGPASVDGDCDGAVGPLLPGTSNFAPGISPVPCACGVPAARQQKKLTSEQAMLAAHGVNIAEEHECDNAQPPQCEGGCPMPGEVCVLVGPFCRCHPLLVVLESFEAKVTRQGVHLRWTTSSEIDNAGFRILRALQGEPPLSITPQLIPSQGSEVSGAEYEFIDTEPKRAGSRYNYYLEDIDIRGEATRHHEPTVVKIERAIHQEKPRTGERSNRDSRVSPDHRKRP
jgi:hypothetical protein